MSPPWESAELAVSSDRPLVRRYRLHQSWYREAVLGAQFGHHGSGTKRRPVGSLLSAEEVERDRALNFLGDIEVLRYVDQRVPAVVRCGGTLEEGRLRYNLLSSMPMAFSLVAVLRGAPDRAAIVSRLFDLEVEDVLVAAPSTTPGCDCHERATHAEWAPDPALHLRDRTAFDAAIWYLDRNGNLGVIGIETKYTETLSPTEYDSERYRRITKPCGWFADGAADVLRGRDTNQLWRKTPCSPPAWSTRRMPAARPPALTSGSSESPATKPCGHRAIGFAARCGNRTASPRDPGSRSSRS